MDTKRNMVLYWMVLGVSCPKLVNPLHGRLQPSTCSYGKTFSGETCRVSCRKGYRPIKSRIITCQSNLQWSPDVTLKDIRNYCIRSEL